MHTESLWREIVWRSPPHEPLLSDTDIHLWWIAVDQHQQASDELAQLLSPDEHRRANEFYHPRDRQRFVIIRGILRSLLGRYLTAHPAHLQFVYGAYGKPALADPFAQRGVSFNLSHSQDKALVAIAKHRRIGIDIEKIRPLSNPQRLIRRILSDYEQTQLQGESSAEQQDTLFYYWTCKEAYIKAVGTGIFQLAKQVEMQWIGSQPRLYQVAGDRQEAQSWQLTCFSPYAEYAGALVAAGWDGQVSYWRYESD